MKRIRHIIIVLFRVITRPLYRNERIRIIMAKYCLPLFFQIMYVHWKGDFVSFRNPKNLDHFVLAASIKNRRNNYMRQKVVDCADKYKVRDYVKEHGYGNTLNELLGVYKNVEEIDWDSLPNRFAMKMNNASGRNLIVKDKRLVDWEAEKHKYVEWLKDREYGMGTGEWQYSLIEPRIIVEQFLEVQGEIAPIDYKFQCIEGRVYSCFVAYDRNPNDQHGEVCYDDYDRNWNRTDAILSEWQKNVRVLPRPVNFDKMIEMAESLTKGFPYCRFDVYEIDGRIIFGEMTFTPQGGVQEFYKEEYLIDAMGFVDSKYCEKGS